LFNKKKQGGVSMNKIHVWVSKQGTIKETTATTAALALYVGCYYTEGFNLVTPANKYKQLINKAKFFAALWLETKDVVL
jgi:hypothetical protein